MRNDLRREKKLPGFFDREVYDILDGGGGTVQGLALALAPSSAAVEAETIAEGVVFDSGRSAAAEDGLFSDFEQEEGGRSPEAVVKELQPIKAAVAIPTPISGNFCGVGGFFFFFGNSRFLGLYNNCGFGSVNFVWLLKI
jgi:hypothetical protein